ncbi:LysR family transcriptional regulator [Jannaschia sp. Os4]|uniref:LysR family transcriptional regulator n=1 Tax=Jannaschia sp. Os4 TaxID=2807617 RepID=UPI00193A9C15|nr:LysR family transcriptional regulator [Jannaschia sp. Os4]MBM2576281.1 LysR family transcriptional regulator [Jannaschia sp. Os4]
MNLRALRVFVGLMDGLADGGTLTRVAERMHLSQSAASRLLSLLEAELGTPLFARERRRMVPLPAAERLHPEAARLLAQADALAGFAASARPTPLRVLCQTRLIPGMAVPALAAATREVARPVRLETAPRRELARRMMAGRHDVVVSTLPAPVEGRRTLTLAEVPLGLLVPRGHPAAGAGALDVADLAGTPYIALDETTVIRRMVDAAAAPLPAPLAEVSSGSAAYRLVAEGVGFTFADRLAVDPDLWPRVALVPWRRDVSVRIGATLAGEAGGAAAAFVDCLRHAVEAAG